MKDYSDRDRLYSDEAFEIVMDLVHYAFLDVSEFMTEEERKKAVEAIKMVEGLWRGVME